MKSTGFVHIVDATLREGEQTPLVRFSTDQASEILKALIKVGVDTVECGHPAISVEEETRVRHIVQASTIPVLAHARARIKDVEAVARTGAEWVGIFIGINEISYKTKMPHRSKMDILSFIKESVSTAKNLGLKVRFTIEDTSRTNLEDIFHTYQVAQECGADRICFADTVGVKPRRT